MFREIVNHSSWKYCESSGRDAGGRYGFHIERSKTNRIGSIILSSGDCGPSDLSLEDYDWSCAENHDTATCIMSNWKETIIITVGRRQS
ncbi:hypothetical protein TNCV_1171901 [Trichonephila clavipes]|uniref:Uncharacterized protein n=1 Tax=Trichonephila clavipes TaxID=2585209 RepID=A0A8X6VEL3_TRICX|nr:hypothetical protein TNCV_1171901 [Trichonephila clavipes]